MHHPLPEAGAVPRQGGQPPVCNFFQVERSGRQVHALLAAAMACGPGRAGQASMEGVQQGMLRQGWQEFLS